MNCVAVTQPISLYGLIVRMAIQHGNADEPTAHAFLLNLPEQQQQQKTIRFL